MHPEYTISDHLCECGCGQYTRVYNQAQKKHPAGEPHTYVHGHNQRGKKHPNPHIQRGKLPSYRAKRIAKFWSRVDKSGGPNACWPWLAGYFSTGYGLFSWGASPYGAHRLAFELTYGAVLPSMFICHRCNNRACCNPRHMFVGLQLDNVTDMFRKGRGQIGERHHQAKLTTDDVREIRVQYKAGVFDAKATSQAKGITLRHAWRIAKGKDWKGIE